MENYKLDAWCGNTFDDVAKKAKIIAEEKNTIVEFEFNGVLCLVSSITNLDWLYRDYANSWTMEWKTVGHDCVEIYSPEVANELKTKTGAREKKSAIQQAKQKEKNEAEKASIDDKIKDETLLIIEGKENEYAEYVKKNSNDGYSRCCVDYSEAWAKLMQLEIKRGTPLIKCAEKTSHKLGYMGITGFMYGCAVSALSHFWKHGEELRKWHNKEYGVSEDKEGVVNPAILTISG